ncbi:MAG: peptidylprolyl isomerase [Candidatus Binatia bacterium]
MKRISLLSRMALAVVFFCAVVASVARAQVVNRIVASVDGEPITLYELEEYARKRSDTVSAMPGRISREDLLQALITEKLVTKEIDAKGIRVGDEDIDHYIERIRQQNRLSEEQLKEALQQQGLSWEQYREQVRGEIQKIQLLNREIRGKVNITPEDVQRHYDAHKEEHRVSAKVHLRHIVLRLEPNAPEEVVEAVRERAEGVRKRIVDDGEDFGAVAKEVSEDPAAAQGGDLGPVDPGKIIPEFEELLPKLEEGEVSEPVRTSAGIHLLMIEKRIAEGYTPIENVSEGIKEKLYNKALDERYRRWLLEDLKKRHYVEIKL